MAMKRLICVPVGTPHKSETYRDRIVYHNAVFVNLHPGKLSSQLHDIRQVYLKHSDRYRNIELREEYDCGHPFHCECAPSLRMWGVRYETDLEQEAFKEGIPPYLTVKYVEK